MMKRAGAEVTGHAGGATGGAADCAKADGWIARLIPNAKIHLEIILMEGFSILDHFRTRFHRRVLRTAVFLPHLVPKFHLGTSPAPREIPFRAGLGSRRAPCDGAFLPFPLLALPAC